MTFSNPRLYDKFDDWPIGGNRRGMCVFKVEDGGKRGWRVLRQTTNKDGRWNKPKYNVFGDRAAIVDGDDGKTYILQFAGGGYDFIRVRSSDFMAAGAFFPGKPGFDEAKSLIEEANK